MNIIVSPVCDPYLNVAAEKYLFDTCTEDTLYFWVNDPCVVIGKNQNPLLECDQAYMREEGILLVRRFTGGGAVYQDRGNLNISLISRDTDTGIFAGYMQKALQACGIDAEISGRNDLTVDGRKISGTASMTEDGRYLRHGTLLLGTDTGKMMKSLRPSNLKIHSHGVDSVRSRVMNLQEKYPDITAEKIQDAMRSLFPGYTEQEYPDSMPEVWELYRKLQSEAWLQRETPGYDALLEYRTDHATYRLTVQVRQQKITSVSVYSDSLEEEDLQGFCRSLQGRIFDPDMILEELKNNAK